MDMIKQMISNGWVPTAICTLQRLLKNHENGKLVLDTPWVGPIGGRPCHMNSSDINALIGKWGVDDRAAKTHCSKSTSGALPNEEEDH